MNEFIFLWVILLLRPARFGPGHGERMRIVFVIIKPRLPTTLSKSHKQEVWMETSNPSWASLIASSTRFAETSGAQVSVLVFYRCNHSRPTLLAGIRVRCRSWKWKHCLSPNCQRSSAHQIRKHLPVTFRSWNHSEVNHVHFKASGINDLNPTLSDLPNSHIDWIYCESHFGVWFSFIGVFF